MATDAVRYEAIGYTDVCRDGTRLWAPWGDGAAAEVHVLAPGEPEHIVGAVTRAIYLDGDRVDAGALVVAWDSQDTGQPGRYWRSDTGQVTTLELLTGQYPVLVLPDGTICYFAASGGARSYVRLAPDGTRSTVPCPLTSQGFGGYDAQGEPILRESVPLQVLGGLTFAKGSYRHGDWRFGGDTHINGRQIAYNHRTNTPFVIGQSTTPIGPKGRMLVDGTAVAAISLPGEFVLSATFTAPAAAPDPPITIPTFAVQPADVIVIGDHTSARQIYVVPEQISADELAALDLPASIRVVFATVGRQDMSAAGALARRHGIPLLAYVDSPTYPPDLVPRLADVDVIPMVEGYPVPLAGGALAPVQTRGAEVGAVLDGLRAAGWSPGIVPPAYRQTHSDGTFSWPLQYVLDLEGVLAEVGRSRGVRLYTPFCQARGTDDGIDHIPAIATSIAAFRAACTWPMPAPGHPSAPSVPDPPAPPSEESPVPDQPAVPPPPPTLEEQLRNYHAPREQSPGPGYVWTGHGWSYYGAGAASAQASQQANAAAQQIMPTMAPAPPASPIVMRPFGRLRADGPLFRLPDGSPWRWQLASLFELPRVVQLGGDPTPLLDDLESIGANGAIVFAQWWWMDAPAVTPFTATPETMQQCARLLAARRMWMEAVGLCDCDPFGQHLAAQIARTEALVTALAGEPYTFYRIGNEPPSNAVDVWGIVDALGFADPAKRPLLMDSGDYDIDSAVQAQRPFRALDYVGDHPPRKPDWANEAAKTGHFDRGGWAPDDHNGGFPGTPAIVLSSEPVKFGASVDGTGETSVLSCEAGAAGFAVDQAGASFHCQSLLRAQRLTEAERAWGQQWNRAMAWVPLDAVTGPYAHDGMEAFPLEPADKTLVGEVAGHRLGNRWYIVASNPLDKWEPIAKPGASILERHGTRGQILIAQQ
jgi:hypothetical protein